MNKPPQSVRRLTNARTRWRHVCAILATVSLAVGPVALLLLWSFTKHWYWPMLLPPEYSLRAWTYVVSPSSGVISALLASGGIALGVTVLALLVALPAARALALTEFK